MAKPQSFKPGDPRINRNGRPKEPWTMTALYKEAGDEADETGLPKKLIVARKLWEIAKKGDVTAIKELGNRIDGMPKQSNELSGHLEVKTLMVKFIEDGDDRDTG